MTLGPRGHRVTPMVLPWSKAVLRFAVAFRCGPPSGFRRDRSVKLKRPR